MKHLIIRGRDKIADFLMINADRRECRFVARDGARVRDAKIVSIDGDPYLQDATGTRYDVDDIAEIHDPCASDVAIHEAIDDLCESCRIDRSMLVAHLLNRMADEADSGEEIETRVCGVRVKAEVDASGEVSLRLTDTDVERIVEAMITEASENRAPTDHDIQEERTTRAGWLRDGMRS